MKKIIPFVAILSVFIVFVSCRKTESDPLISLRSRETRVEGKWMVVSYNSYITYRDNTPNAPLYFEKSYIEGENFVVNANDLCYSIYKNKKWIYNFDKLGNFETEKTVQLMQDCRGFITTDSVRIEKETGYWNLAGGARDSKKKTELLLYTTNYSQQFGSYTNNTNNSTPRPFAWNIKTLKNKEMHLTHKSSFNTQTNSNVGYTLESEYEMVLIQK